MKTLKRYAVLSYDTDEHQLFIDFVLSTELRNAELHCAKKRADYAEVIGTFTPEELSRWSRNLKKAPLELLRPFGCEMANISEADIRQLIARYNNKELETSRDEDGKILIPAKPSKVFWKQLRERLRVMLEKELLDWSEIRVLGEEPS